MSKQVAFARERTVWYFDDGGEDRHNWDFIHLYRFRKRIKTMEKILYPILSKHLLLVSRNCNINLSEIMYSIKK